MAKRTYHSFDPKVGYPAGDDLSYECTLCGDVIPSLPQTASHASAATSESTQITVESL
jgi:hypothetical protein